MKKYILGFLIFSLTYPAVFAAVTPTRLKAVLVSVSGKVHIKNKKSKKIRKAKRLSNVYVGDRILTGTDSTATLELFDGSQIGISPKTDFQLTRLQQPSVLDKVISFKLLVGQLLATVKKLSSSKSSFEIEAGGVVCGVRGTRYALSFDPEGNKVSLKVLEGTVYAHWSGHQEDYPAPSEASWTNGNLDKGKENINPLNAKGVTGKQGWNPNPFPGWLPGLTGHVPDALSDLGSAFGLGVAQGHNNGFTDPGVEGSIHLGVEVYVPPVEVGSPVIITNPVTAGVRTR